MIKPAGEARPDRAPRPLSVEIFLCGDVMTGRGIDQILPHPCVPALHEPYVSSALDYLDLAERKNGTIPRGAAPAYVWGEALGVLERERPDLRIINLETSVTTSEDVVPKGINYRMNPANVGVLTAARIDCCVLANNHVLDWGLAGLAETLDTLEDTGIAVAGAGFDIAEARAPAILETAAGVRVFVFAIGGLDSGVPPDWSAGEGIPGVFFAADYSARTVDAIGALVGDHRRRGDLVILSVHWGENWGYEVPRGHRNFAREVIDHAGVDVVHGHSSHHPRGIEVYGGRPIFYGCGDFLNDYEGISGYERFRDDLVVMYFVTFEGGRLSRLRMTPLKIEKFRLRVPDSADQAWIASRLDRECGRFGHRVRSREGMLSLEF